MILEYFDSVTNPLLAALPAFAITTVIAFIVLFLLKIVVFAKINRFVQHTKNTVDDSVVSVAANVRTVSLIVFAIYIGSFQLPLTTDLNLLLKMFFIFTVCLEVIHALEVIVLKVAYTTIEHPSTITALKLVMRIVLWLIAVLLLLSNLGFNITSLLAGLGIGGLAISLALQNVFQDLFSSFSLLIDKPFEAGDFIVVGSEYKGTVKTIGLKSTRLTSLQGEELIVPNSIMTSEKVQNFKRLKQRRIEMHIGVTYNTAPALLRKIPELIESCVNIGEKTDFVRAHLQEFGDSALLYEVVYIIQSKEYLDYVKAEESINIALVETFAKEGIEFAYPTQTVHLVK